MTKSNALSIKDIERYAGLQGVRKRPQMYAGTMDEYARWTIVREPADNIVDQFLAKRCKRGTIIIDGDTAYVIDDGMGIPVEKKEFTDERGRKEKLSGLYVVTCLLHAGSNFSGKHASRGTHGAGIKISNALSTSFGAYTKRKGGEWYGLTTAKGVLVKDVHKTKPPKLPFGVKLPAHGTIITFTADTSLFGGSKLNIENARDWCTLTSFLVPGLEITLVYKGKSKVYKTQSSDAYFDYRMKGAEQNFIGKPFIHSGKFANVMIQWGGVIGDQVLCYTNGLLNSAGGEHHKAFYAALKATLAEYCTAKQDITVHDLREGIVGLVNIKLPAPTFNNQVKEKLIDPRAYSAFYDEVFPALQEFFAKNKTLAKEVIKKASAFSALNEKFKASRELTNKVKKATKSVISKLSDASTRVPVQDREIYICEGDSAAGGAKQARFRDFQAVFPLKGKPLNVAEASPDKINSNTEIIDLLGALGIDLEKESVTPRYGKIIIMSDADVDGPLRGDTRVLLLDGTRPTIKELAKQWEIDPKPFWVLSRDKKGNLVPAQAYAPRVTCYKDAYYRITFDDGTVVRCTNKHGFMLNTDNGLVMTPAHKLKVGNSVNSAYLSKTNADGCGSGDYLSVGEKVAGLTDYKKTPLHRIVYAHVNPTKIKKWKKENKGSGVGGKWHIHHINEDKKDNTPDNLEMLSKRKHGREHLQAYSAEYNGSRKHKKDLKKFYASAAGRKIKRKASAALTTYNKSAKHRETVSEMNKDPKIMDLQLLGKCAKYLASLRHAGYRINAENWNAHLTAAGASSVPRWENKPCLINIEQMAKRKGYGSNVAYDLTPVKRSYPTQGVTKFVNTCKLVVERGMTLNEKNYNLVRDSLPARGTPKWEVYTELLNLQPNDVKGFVEKQDKLRVNHTIVAIDKVKTKNKIPFYCLSVPDYGNFFMADKDGNGICTSNSHIRSLLVGLFFRFVPHLVKKGMIYAVDAPLFRCITSKGTFFGNDRAALRDEHGKAADITYLKGIGEVNPQDLKKIAMDPATRKLIRLVMPKDPRDVSEYMRLLGGDSTYKKAALGISRGEV